MSDFFGVELPGSVVIGLWILIGLGFLIVQSLWYARSIRRNEAIQRISEAQQARTQEQQDRADAQQRQAQEVLDRQEALLTRVEKLLQQFEQERKP